MEALVPTLVAALIAGIGDQPAWYVARLSDAARATAATLGCLLIVHVIAATLMATAGGLAAPILTPNAKALLVALALGAAGIGSLIKMPPIGGVDALATGGFVTTLVQMIRITAIDRTAFIVFAFAARGPSPQLAAIGGLTGAVALAVIAMTLGAASWRAFPWRAITLIAGSLLLIAALLTGLGALRLI